MELRSQDYVSNGSWLRQAARVDTVDVVADEFERPASSGVLSFWSPGRQAWPRSARGWRSSGRPHLSMSREMGADLAG